MNSRAVENETSCISSIDPPAQSGRTSGRLSPFQLRTSWMSTKLTPIVASSESSGRL